MGEPFISTDTCNECAHFTVMLDARKRRVAMVVNTGWPGMDVLDKYETRHVDAIGVGHCEHPTQPRGLVMCIYACGNFAPKGTELVAPKPSGMRDITPNRKAIANV